MKIIIFSQKRCGSHFFSRSLSKNLNLPWKVFNEYSPKNLINNDKYVIACHDFLDKEDRNNLNLSSIKYFNVYRNPHDHLYSLYIANKNKVFGNEIEFNSIKDLALSEYYYEIRKKILLFDQKETISYDILSNKNDIRYKEELKKMKDILSIKNKIIKMEDFKNVKDRYNYFFWTNELLHSLDKLTPTEIKLILCVENSIKKEINSNISY